MGFTASNVPQWSGNGNELTNGVPLSSLGGTSVSEKVVRIQTITPSAATDMIFNSIPTTYKHLWINMTRLTSVSAAITYMYLSTDNGATYGTGIPITTSTASTWIADVNIYDTGFSGKNKIINVMTWVGTSPNIINVQTIENVKTGLINCIKISNGVGYALTSSRLVSLFGF